MQNQMRMGHGLRDYISINPLNYLRSAPRLHAAQERVYFSGVELTDVSFYQKVIDFAKMKAANVAGTIIRAGQNEWVDPFFDTNWGAAKAAGLPRGSYFFYDSRKHWRDQADLYWSLIKNDMGELMVTADYEENYGGAYGGWKNLYNFLDRLMGNGVPMSKLWIYSGYYYWLDHSPQNDPAALAYFKQHKLWLAWYTNNPSSVKVPKPWFPEDVPLWQYGTPAVGAQYGVQTAEIDMNQWMGDLAAYKSYWNLNGGTTPPPSGDSMYYGTVNTEGLNIRNGPGASYQDIGDLVQNDYVEATEILGGWWHLSKINGVPVTQTSWASGTYILPAAPPTPERVPFTLIVAGFKPFEGELEVDPNV